MNEIFESWWIDNKGHYIHLVIEEAARKRALVVFEAGQKSGMERAAEISDIAEGNKYGIQGIGDIIRKEIKP